MWRHPLSGVAGSHPLPPYPRPDPGGSTLAASKLDCPGAQQPGVGAPRQMEKEQLSCLDGRVKKTSGGSFYLRVSADSLRLHGAQDWFYVLHFTDEETDSQK